MSQDTGSRISVPGSITDATTSAGTQDSELKAKVIRVMANTMNGCLTELGYHPDIYAQMNAVHEWNIRLRDENAKLLDDNRSLAQLISVQNERLTKESSSSHTVPGVNELQRRIQALEVDRQAMLTQRHHTMNELLFLRHEVARLQQITSPTSTNPHPYVVPPPFVPALNGAVPRLSPYGPGFPTVQHLGRHRPPLPAIDTAITSSTMERRHSSSARASPVSFFASGSRPASASSRIGSISKEASRMGLEEQREVVIDTIPAPVNDDINVEMIDLVHDSGAECEERAPKRPRLETENDVLEADILQDCVEAGFDDDEEDETSGKRWCRMCRYVQVIMYPHTFIFETIEYRSRHLTGVVEEAPEPFVNASVEELVQHCEREHPKGWESLKQSIQAQTDSE
ncbi:uncharacterized protein FIBRA_02709 [Fibroporia radiculosa]|uniref:Uncharacterized protein n=1 Tax=Fibroporia radiculosa TaxID=599839 RepID=J4GN21_9APHY|nr:uncharacterized protein FIBRA_02709 [Fibroporia radiculosa]CCM00670.1 predicted protein [Fibroporia radiculosa]